MPGGGGGIQRAGSGPLLLTGCPVLAAAWGRSRLPQPPSSHRTRFRPRSPCGMLLLLLLLPLCRAVEVKRPRGVSLTSEFAGGGGRAWEEPPCGFWGLAAFYLSGPGTSPGGWVWRRWCFVEKASLLPFSLDHHFYDESKPFTCLDGSATIPFDQVNDDYCDCKDGSDEPGELPISLPSFFPLYI